MSQSDLTKWEVNGLVFELDLEDYDDARRYEEAFSKLSIKESEIQKDGMLTDKMKAYCDLYYTLFDDLFGAGSGQKIFNGKYNTRVCEEVFNSFFEFAKIQANKGFERRQKMAVKYQPKHK